MVNLVPRLNRNILLTRAADLRVPGYVEGVVRRFWQARYASSITQITTEYPRSLTDVVRSQDHRGTPEDPGRVVTLIDRAHWEKLTDHVLHPT
jgi:hypothetical protein